MKVFAAMLAGSLLANTGRSAPGALERGSVYRAMITGGFSMRNVASEMPRPPPAAAPPKS